VFDNVVIGVDGRSGGRDAIALAKRLAAPDARVTLAHVYGSEGMLGRGGGIVVAAGRLSPPDARTQSRCSSTSARRLRWRQS
jgi:hypothetical protein